MVPIYLVCLRRCRWVTAACVYTIRGQDTANNLNINKVLTRELCMRLFTLRDYRSHSRPCPQLVPLSIESWVQKAHEICKCQVPIDYRNTFTNVYLIIMLPSAFRIEINRQRYNFLTNLVHIQQCIYLFLLLFLLLILIIKNEKKIYVV